MSINFPPYGLMNADLLGHLADYPYPEGYVPPAGKSPEQGWQEVYTPMVDRLAATLWPRWRGPKGKPPSWDGAAAAGMEALTLADFKVMQGLRSKFGEAVSQQAAGQAPIPSAQSHAEFFKVEDDSNQPLPMLSYFTFGERLGFLNAAQQNGMSPVHDRVGHWMGAHCTSSTLPAKIEIQRPRPYQMASILGFDDFAYEFAEGAVTSALPSGHSIQGVQGVCSGYLELAALMPLDPKTVARMRQYAVDHGDRRVFAGVHYPSDNLASWCMALYLCDALYGARASEARAFLAEAVVQHSQVYRAIIASKDPAYKAGLDWLQALITPDAQTPSAEPARKQKSARRT